MCFLQCPRCCASSTSFGDLVPALELYFHGMNMLEACGAYVRSSKEVSEEIVTSHDL